MLRLRPDFSWAFPVAELDIDHTGRPFKSSPLLIDALEALGPREILPVAVRLMNWPDRDLANAAFLGRGMVSSALAGVRSVLGVYDRFLYSINELIQKETLRKIVKDREEIVVDDISPDGPDESQARPQPTDYTRLRYLELSAAEAITERKPSVSESDEYPEPEFLQQDEMRPATVISDDGWEGALDAVVLSPATHDPEKTSIMESLLQALMESEKAERSSSSDNDDPQKRGPSRELSKMIAAEANLARAMADRIFELEVRRERFAVAFELYMPVFKDMWVF